MGVVEIQNNSLSAFSTPLLEPTLPDAPMTSTVAMISSLKFADEDIGSLFCLGLSV